MQGDTIIIEPHHRAAARAIVPILVPRITASKGKYTITVAGESGSGKSETAMAIAEALTEKQVASVILQQDDYFVYPPISNDRARREDIGWVGPQEVKLNLLDDHLRSFLDGSESIEKPLVIYEDDRVTTEMISLQGADVAIAEGTYTTLLDNANARIFIDRSYEDTRAHREKRKRHASELDPFLDNVLKIEHEIISTHKARADIVIGKDFSVAEVKRS